MHILLFLLLQNIIRCPVTTYICIIILYIPTRALHNRYRLQRNSITLPVFLVGLHNIILIQAHTHTPIHIVYLPEVASCYFNNIRIGATHNRLYYSYHNIIILTRQYFLLTLLLLSFVVVYEGF